MYSGFVEAIDAKAVRGWVYDRTEPARALTVELVVDGWPISSIAVDLDRADLAALGIGRSNVAFVLPVPSDTMIDAARMSVRVVGAREPLPWLDEACRIDGVIEAVTPAAISGWAWHVGHPRKRLMLDVKVGGQVVASAPAELFRSDLLEGSIGDGYYGYRMALTLDAAAIAPGTIQVVDRGSGTILHDLRLGVGQAVRPAPAKPAEPPLPVAATPARAAPVAPTPAPAPAPAKAPPAVPAANPRVQIEAAPATVTISREAAEALRQAMGLNIDEDSVF